MIRRLMERLARHRDAWREADSTIQALGNLALYAALRTWAAVMCSFPVEANLATARMMGRIWPRLMPKHLERAMDNLRPALGDRYDDRQLRRIAQRSLEHFAQVYLVELIMTPRLIHQTSWARWIELGTLDDVLPLLLSGGPAMMLTPHFGNYELLGFTIARLGLPLSAIMRPLDNPLVNEWLESTRRAGGVTLLHKKGAMAQAAELLDAGATLCFIADQDAGRKGYFAPFFGREASWYKSIPLVAASKRVPLIIGGAIRVGRGFRYRFHLERIIRPDEWERQDDPIDWITRTMAAALESLIRRAPEQYLWMHRRWKSRPRHERVSAAPQAPAATG